MFACAGLTLADGLTELELWERVRGPRAVGRLASLPAIATGLLSALAVGAVFVLLVGTGETAHDNYRSQTGLSIPGATRLHLAPTTSAQFDQIYTVLRAHCSTLISLPALHSFNIWTGLPWPNAIGGGAQPYWKELSASQQQQTLTAARRSPRLCLIQDPTETADYGTVTQTPLIKYLQGSSFRVILSSPPYSVAVRRR